MNNLVKCDICGKVPTIKKSHSSRMISHKCKDFRSGWGSMSKVIEDWNQSNSPTLEEVNSSTSNNTERDEICEWKKVDGVDLWSISCGGCTSEYFKSYKYCPLCGRKLSPVS